MTKWCGGLLMVWISVGGVFAESQSNLTPSQDEGMLRLPAGISLRVTGPDGVSRMVEPENATAALPVGTYKLNYWTYQKHDAQGDRWELRGYGGPIKEFQIGPEPVVLDIKPEPVDVSIDVRSGDGYLLILALKGPAGERLYLSGGQNPNVPPPIIITNQDKTFSVTLTGKYG